MFKWLRKSPKGAAAPPPPQAPSVESHQWEPSTPWRQKHYIAQGQVTTKLRGVTHEGRQDVLATLSAGDRLDVLASDSAEFPDGIRLLTPDGRDVGWLPADRARELKPYLDGTGEWSKPQKMDAWILDVTGGTSEKPNRGLNVWVAMRRNRGRGDGPWQHDHYQPPLVSMFESLVNPFPERRGFEPSLSVLRPGDHLTPKREPTNEYDSNAVLLVGGSRNRLVGYIGSGQAEDVAPLMDGGMRVECIVSEVWSSVVGLIDGQTQVDVNAKVLVFAYPPEYEYLLRPMVADLADRIRDDMHTLTHSVDVRGSDADSLAFEISDDDYQPAYRVT